MLLHSAGLGNLVRQALVRDIGGRVIFADDSAIMIDTRAPADKITKLSYLKNAYAVIGTVPRRGALQRSLDDLARRVGGWELGTGRRPFRVMFSEDGKLAAVPPRARARIEDEISRRTRGAVNRRGGRGDEYWVLTRRDFDQVIFGARLALPKQPGTPAGALRPDLAALLVSASDPQPDDVFLDPFGGSGALVAARLASPLRRAIYSDIAHGTRGGPPLDPSVARSRIVTVLAEDARELPSVADRTVDAVVTDPPWGEYEPGNQRPDRQRSGGQRSGSQRSAGQGSEKGYDALIDATLTTLERVLRPSGRLVMLTSRRLAGTTLQQWRAHRFVVRATHDLLVNGHPATVIIGGRETAAS